MSRRFDRISDEQWRTFVADIAEALELREGDRVFEVHCGAGAFLLPLYEAGCAVGGNDPDPRLIELAKYDMPDGEWSIGEVTETPTWDVVVACSLLNASSTLTDAADMLEKMARKATAAVALLDVPDGRPFDERWFLRALAGMGFASVRLPGLRIEGYKEDVPRFNVIARLA